LKIDFFFAIYASSRRRIVSFMLAKKKVAAKMAAKKVARTVAKKAPQKATAKQTAKQELAMQSVALELECASAVAEQMRERGRDRIDAFGADVRFAMLARDIWREHPGHTPELVSLLDRYLQSAAAQTDALTIIVDALGALAELPEEQHVHLPDGTVTVERVRAAGVTSD
jgi:hypothetical protein